MKDDASQRFFNIRILKLKSGIQQTSRDYALAFEQNGAEFSQNEFNHEAGCGQEGGTMQHPADGLPQFFITDRMGRTEVDRTGYFPVMQYKAERCGEVLYVYPGKPLTPAAQRPAQKKFKQRDHLAQRAAILTEHDTEARDHHAGAFFFGPQGLFFPVFRELCQKIIAGLCRFGKFFIFMKPVISDSGGAEKSDVS
jgi:hypothetical protein